MCGFSFISPRKKHLIYGVAYRVNHKQTAKTFSVKQHFRCYSRMYFLLTLEKQSAAERFQKICRISVILISINVKPGVYLCFFVLFFINPKLKF